MIGTLPGTMAAPYAVAEPFATSDRDSGLMFAVPAGRTVTVADIDSEGRALVVARAWTLPGGFGRGWVDTATVLRCLCPVEWDHGFAPSVRVGARLVELVEDPDCQELSPRWLTDDTGERTYCVRHRHVGGDHVAGDGRVWPDVR